MIRTQGDDAITTYATPGIYQAPVASSPDIRLVRTDIAGFVGFAERGPLVDLSEPDPGVRAQAAVRLNSWNDFRRIFGGFVPYGYLAYAVRGFFATGGQTCYVVRVGVAETPPATALMTLPAAIVSTQIANVAATKPSDGLTQAGVPVFALSGPAVATQVTSVASATTVGATQLQLDSSGVNGISSGSLIAIGDPLSGECVQVASIVDAQTIKVQSPLSSIHAAGEAVYPIAGTALTAPAAKGATSLQVADISALAVGDLVSVEGGGVAEIRVLTAQPKASAIQVGLPLQFAYDSGTVVRKYTAALTVSAYSPGDWGNRIKLSIKPLDSGNAVTRFSMLVTVSQGDDSMQPLQQEFYPLLSLNPYDPYPLTSTDSALTSLPSGTPRQTSSIYVVDAVNNVSQLIRVSVVSSLPDMTQRMQLLVNNGPLQSNDLYLEGGSDGTPGMAPLVSVEPASNTRGSQVATAPAASIPKPYTLPPASSDQDFYDALDVLGLVDEIGILCCPDATPPAPPATVGWSMNNIQQAMVNQCVQKQYRVAVLDTPQSMTPAQALGWLSQFAYTEASARFASVYYPWLKVPDELGIEGTNRTVPPSGHVAGAYAYTDKHSGVQKPPANVELQFVSDVQLAVTDQQQGFLNPAGINCIRPFAGRGIRVWGARSLSRDPNWKYIHRRRLMSMIEDSVEQATRWVVFRANDDNLRRTLTHSLNVFLQMIWRAGGLEGARPSEAYFVKCDSTNNTSTTIDAGQLICQIGVAVAAPMEFLVFEMRRSVAGAQVVEA